MVRQALVLAGILVVSRGVPAEGAPAPSPKPAGPTAARAAAKAAEKAEDAAQAAAEAWLKTVDDGRHGESWDQAARMFRDQVPRDQWQKAVTAARRPLGRVLSRKVKSRHAADSLPGAPPGKYVVLQFDTAFENRARAVETVTPVREADGSWRVAGYYVR